MKRSRRLHHLLPTLALAALLTACAGDDWRTARRDSAGIAPLPEAHEAAVVQVYSAAVYGWRGAVADHSWIAVKPHGASSYRRYEVLGWRLRRGQSVVAVSEGVPDRYWYGSEPRLHVDLRGEAAEALIPCIAEASRAYPWADEYTMFPGPNSNSYIEWIGLSVPALGLQLPWRALGRNWMRQHFDASLAVAPDALDGGPGASAGADVASCTAAAQAASSASRAVSASG